MVNPKESHKYACITYLLTTRVCMYYTSMHVLHKNEDFVELGMKYIGVKWILLKFPNEHAF